MGQRDREISLALDGGAVVAKTASLLLLRMLPSAGFVLLLCGSSVAGIESLWQQGWSPRGNREKRELARRYGR